MAIQDHFKAFSLYDLKLAKVTGDTPGTLIDCPGVQSCKVTIATEAVELRGDNQVIAAVDKGNSLEFEFVVGGLAIPVLEEVLGVDATDTGTTPAVVRRLDFSASTARPYFAFAGFTKGDDGAQSMDVIVWKAKITSGFDPVDWKDGEFQVITFSGTGIAPTSGGNAGKLASLIQKETAGSAAALPA